MNAVLLDTSALIALERGTEIEKDILENASNFLLPTIVIAEFLQTAHKSSAPRKLLSQREALLEKLQTFVTVTEFDEASSRIYAKLWARLSDLGKPKSVIDLQLAALAKRHKAQVVSLDARADFEFLVRLLD